MHLEHSLVIPVRPEVVWAVTIDLERWPEWTPTMERIERLDSGPIRVGSQAKIKQPQFKEAVWTVTALTPGRGFTWATRTGGLTMAASHEVLPAPGGCTSILQLDITGLVALLLAPIVRRGAAKAMATENICLSKRCQAMDVLR